MRRRTHLWAAAWLVLGAFALSACGDDGVAPPVIASVEVAPAAVMLAPGGNQQLTATAKDASGTVISATFAWSSSNLSAATVDAAGLVTAVAPGISTVTASAGGQSGNSTISVEAPVDSVAVAPAADTVEVGSTVTFTATAFDAAGNPLTGRTVNWSIDNTAVATVSSTGVVTGVGSGDAVATAEIEGVSATAGVHVFVGVTGTWAGTITAPVGACAMTMSITEDAAGAITGSGTVSGACVGFTNPFTLTGANNSGGVPDSVTTNWTDSGGNMFTLGGIFDGVDTLVAVVNGAGCVNCPASLVRSSVVPTAPVVIAAPTDGSRPRKSEAGFERK